MARPSRAATSALALALSLAPLAACSDEVITPTPPALPHIERLITSPALRVDLLLSIDNSRNMADKQRLLAQAIPDLVRGLVNPRCVDFTSGLPAATQPTGPFEPCPAGARRERQPVLDLHVGVISSSLGGHGSDACQTTETTSCIGAPNGSNDDGAHLLSRSNGCGGASIATYQGKGFLAWDPAQKLSPPGEKNVGDTMGEPGLAPTLRDMVLGVGQVGCGYEAQLESWYRFLIDPEPYQTITVEGGKAVAKGIDTALLEQRADFLRSSSMLAILMLSDENDCSIKELGQFYLIAQQHSPNNPSQDFHLPRARTICATDPTSECCRSCGQPVPAGCPDDPVCTSNPTLSSAEDDINLRCFDQKRRFGIDFLYPIDRYTTGLTSPTVPNRAGELVPNPIFSDLNPNDGDPSVRDRTYVILAGIAGVPWQDIARDPQDLSKGIKTYDELSAETQSGDSTWDIILGDLTNHVSPKDPHMIESVAPRSGQNPITGDAIAQPTAPSDANPINGHERTIDNDDLQYACVFPLPAPRDCSVPANAAGCDCVDPSNDNPLCEANPNDQGKRTLQTRAKAYPGLRELAVIESMEQQGFVGSICPASVGNEAKADDGYRPTMAALLERMPQEPLLVGVCLQRALPLDGAGRAACMIAEARETGGQCACSAAEGRRPVSAEHQSLLDAIEQNASVVNAGMDCICEIEQLAGDALMACQNDPSEPLWIEGEGGSGFCYVDLDAGAGSPEVAKSCPQDEKRLLRFAGAGRPKSGALTFITCAGW